MSNKRKRPTPLGLQILREPAVLQFSALPRSQLWKHVKNGTFPKPVRLSDQGRAVGGCWKSCWRGVSSASPHAIKQIPLPPRDCTEPTRDYGDD
jgi:hypothetical protein